MHLDFEFYITHLYYGVCMKCKHESDFEFVKHEFKNLREFVQHDSL